MAAPGEAAKRRQAAFERVLKALGRYSIVPPAKAPELERDRFAAEVMADMADKLAEVAKAVEALDRRVAKLERKPKAPSK